MKRFTISELNDMERDDFVAALGSIFEHSPWVAEQAWSSQPFVDKETMHNSMMNIVEQSSEEEKLKLFRLHPDLASRIQMSEYSVKEQQEAGLTNISSEQYEQFCAYNDAYMTKFGFPFIVAVKGKTQKNILEAMKSRVNNELENEIKQALSEIACITRYRVEDCIIGGE